MAKQSTAEDVDRHASKKLAAVLRAEIIEGRLAAGARLPSTRQLEERHGVARNTANAALRLLQAEGLVIVRPGSGSYVRTKSETADVRAELEKVRNQLRQTQETLSMAERAMTALLERLPADPSRSGREAAASD